MNAPARPPAAQAAIEIDGLEKTYSNGKRALDGVSLTVPRGTMFGLLGPNGAGKSTLINILAGLVVKSAGHASVWGFDIDRQARNARACIGVVPQELIFDAYFTAREVLAFQAGLYGVPRAERRIDEVLRAVRLTEQADAYSRTLSGGMKRRLLVAKAIVHNPPVLVLDEPTAGVDIELRQQLWTYVRELHARGTTVVLTTHYLEEAEQLCDRVAIINGGRVVADEPTPALLARAHDKVVVATVDRDLSAAPGDLPATKVELVSPRQLVITYDKTRVHAGAVLQALTVAGLGLVDVTTREADLEDVFLQLTRNHG